MMRATLYAKAGEAVTCETCGAVLGNFCNNVRVGDTARSADFVLPSGEHPAPMSFMPRCLCGGRGFRCMLGVWVHQAHFADGWRGVKR